MKFLTLLFVTSGLAAAETPIAELYGPPEPLAPAIGATTESEQMVETVSALQKDAARLHARILELEKEIAE